MIRHDLAVHVALFASLLGPLGCEKDEVLPSKATPSICGNGVLEPGEACDNESAGCIDCQVAPEWTCPDNVCTVTCDDPGVAPSGLGCTRATTCNMEGYWAVRETDATQTDGLVQTSTQWYLYHLTQAVGASSYSIDTALDCGIHVTGNATVDYTANSQRFLMYASGIDQGPPQGHGPRHGVAEATNGGCNVSLDRFFFVRGATATYLPTTYDNDASLPSLVSEPWLDAPPLPAQPPGSTLAYDTHFPTGAVNTDGASDGGVMYPGLAVQISGTISGERHSAQRNYKGYASKDPVAASALSFRFPGNYSLQESVFAVTDCTLLACDLLATVASPAPTPPSVTFSYIGLSATSARAASVILGPPKAMYATDLATCANIRLVLPHDGSIHDGSAGADAAAP